MVTTLNRAKGITADLTYCREITVTCLHDSEGAATCKKDYIQQALSAAGLESKASKLSVSADDLDTYRTKWLDRETKLLSTLDCKSPLDTDRVDFDRRGTRK